MKIIEIQRMPITQQEIIKFLNENFVGKPKSLQLTEEIAHFKEKWVQSVIANGQEKEALKAYINLFYLQ